MHAPKTKAKKVSEDEHKEAKGTVANKVLVQKMPAHVLKDHGHIGGFDFEYERARLR